MERCNHALTKITGRFAQVEYRSQTFLGPSIFGNLKIVQSAGHIVVLISQIDRAYDPGAKPLPDLTDVRLPNPVDLSLFSKSCFLHDGEIRLDAA